MALIVDTAADPADDAIQVVDLDDVEVVTQSVDAALPPAHLSHRRVATLWDVAGLALVTFVMMCVTEYAVDTVEGGLYRLPFLRPVTVGSGVVALVALAAAPLFKPVRILQVPAQLTEIWRDPPGDWPAFALGMALALPLLGLFTPTILGDADSVRIVAAVRHVQRDGTGFLVDTQDNLLPHVILGPAAALGGIEAVRVVTIISLQALAGVVALVARRVSGSMWAAMFAVFGLLAIPVVVDRAILVPMYPTMLAFGYLGGWLAYRGMTEDRAWRCIVGAALCLVLSMEAQSVGQLFLVTPLMLLVVTRGFGRGLFRMGCVYAATVVFLLPRLWINVQQGGFERITSNRTDYWINKGYVQKIQVDMWHYVGVDEPMGTYVQRLPERFVDSLGAWGWLPFLAGLVALIGLKGRARLLPLACLGFMALAATVKGVPPFGRYFSPLWPGAAVLAGLTGAWFLRQRVKLLKPVGLACGVVLLIGSVDAYDRVAHKALRLDQNLQVAPYHDFVPLIDDGKGVIGSRSHILVNYTADIATYGGQFLTEDEYVTFLTWPSDAEVIAMMQQHDIGWVLVNANLLLEVDYHNTWLVPNHGREARHVVALAGSPWFCRVASKQGYVLYQLQEIGDPPCQWQLPPELPRPARDPELTLYGAGGPPPWQDASGGKSKDDAGFPGTLPDGQLPPPGTFPAGSSTTLPPASVTEVPPGFPTPTTTNPPNPFGPPPSGPTTTAPDPFGPDVIPGA
ncbi:MAG TPA: hypothetical protein VGO78_27530 [Acidimicrobiales bacterium]|nr:hypothetical protein [Acidimicrobiales bacterium]